MSTIGFLINPTKVGEHSQGPALVTQAIEGLTSRGQQVLVNEEAAPLVAGAGQPSTVSDLEERVNLLIVLGGDGTILHGARLAAGRDEVEERMMLQADVERDGMRLQRFLGLNDAVVTKSGVARVLRLTAWVNDELLASYPADGLVVSTPTGSTAYSLSAGGPIVHPRLEVIIITPISPHTFNARAVIVSRDDPVTIELPAATQDARLTVYGQVGYPIEAGDRVVVQRAVPTPNR